LQQKEKQLQELLQEQEQSSSKKNEVLSNYEALLKQTQASL